MDLLLLFKAFALGVVEGLTEFLPVSSTGHLIIAGDLLAFEGEAADTFFVAIQAGAILAVCWHYRARIIAILRHFAHPGKERRLAVNTALAFLPAAVIGVMAASAIKRYLFNSMTVAAVLVAGGVIILLLERRLQGKAPRVAGMDDMSWKDALGVGLLQCLAMIPGTSRSGATIIGGLALGLSRTAATEFSFFLAIPTIFGASAYDLFKNPPALASGDLLAFAAGFAVSFASAIAVIRWLLAFVANNDFRGFGWYRIAFGLLILALGQSGLVQF
ncbi:MAG: undecaprenyl-diphosphate phosphatase [Duodenibacillus sp.]|nr:undecaprenyl-diphosphate phosphatase [Duodenibacillus sp.]